jgi:2-alkyl-3-oxoalkanoate reductase
MNVLVTGGGGFLGRYIVEQLVERGERVRVLCRHHYPELAALGVEQVHGDVADMAAVDRAVRDMDRVFHVAAMVGFWGSYRDYFRTNVIGTQNVIDACVAHGVKKLVYTSSPSVTMNNRDIHGGDESLPYPDYYHSPYSATKAEAERRVLQANGRGGLVTTAIRPHLILGPRDNHLIPRLLDKARRGRLKQIGDGRNKVSVVYVENAAHAHLQAADSDNVGGKAYFINEPEPLLLWPWINNLLELLELPRVQRKVPFPLAFFAGHVLEILHRLIPALGEPMVTRFLAAELYRNHYFSIARAQRDFDYQPLYSFAEAQELTLAYLKTRGGH